MKYFFKQGFFPFIYLIFMAITAYGITTIDGLTWLKIVLVILNIGLYIFIISALAFKSGEDALGVRVRNDIERREIIKTGEDRPLKLTEEYKPYKGFIIGLFACIPLILFLLLHTLFVIIGSNYVGFGALTELIYYMFYSLYNVFGGTTTAYSYYFSLIALPIISLSTGIPYIMGAKKIELQQERIKEKHQQIYGDKK